MHRLSVDVVLREGTDPEALAERLFDLLASDPEDLFPEIVTVDYYEGREIDG